ncbi:glycoside hydrolase family 3 N-terminal domain-containing protein [Dongia deserti]|uniref:glycoside hydrolase family 3 N-terminal domain-containing protein n=1 Tax=Dongia deserti TaxID=2268030 RepID=UPI000E64EB14|nr:glycoside hydrolase family 3 N-terminal domain-containing protein [Dongia deserti]
MSTIIEDAHAVLLPAIADLELPDALKQFLDRGGRSILLGETRGEYVARRMAPERIQAESRDHFIELAEQVRRRAGPSLIAVDQEPAGIQRLHSLVPSLADLAELQQMSDSAIETSCREIASAARSMGVTMFLAPILDVVTGRNPWLAGRTLGADHREVARIAAASVRGFQTGGVIAVAKHFPGHPDIDCDPAVAEATVPLSMAQLEPGLAVFRSVIAARVHAVMLGPALVPAVDPKEPSSTSRTTARMLRKGLGFRGLVVSDDLDAKATLRGRPLAETAVASLKAGADLLLVAAGDHLEALCGAIAQAVADGRLDRERLSAAADRVRAAARDLPPMKKGIET